MLRREIVFHAHCWCFKLMTPERTITGSGQLLQDATHWVVKALGTGHGDGVTLTLFKFPNKH